MTVVVASFSGLLGLRSVDREKSSQTEMDVFWTSRKGSYSGRTRRRRLPPRHTWCTEWSRTSCAWAVKRRGLFSCLSNCWQNRTVTARHERETTRETWLRYFVCQVLIQSLFSVSPPISSFMCKHAMYASYVINEKGNRLFIQNRRGNDVTVREEKFLCMNLMISSVWFVVCSRW